MQLVIWVVVSLFVLLELRLTTTASGGGSLTLGRLFANAKWESLDQILDLFPHSLQRYLYNPIEF